MQKIEIPNRVLLAVAERMMSIRSGQNIDDFIFSILCHSKLKDWHKNNGVRVVTLSNKIDDLRKCHFVFEGEKNKGTMKMQAGKKILVTPAKMNEDEIVEDAVYSDGPQEPVCLEGKTIEEFNDRYKSLMEEINIMEF